MNLKIDKKTLDNVLDNVTEMSYLLKNQKDLYNVLALENITTSKTITLGDLYEYESHLKRLRLSFPSGVKKEKEVLYMGDVDKILINITSVIRQIENKNKLG